MALVLKDRVLESSTSTGTGSFTLTGAQTGYQSFSAIGNGNTTYYTIQGKNPDGTLTGEWEVGVGTWSTGNTLARNTVLSNSLGTTAKIVFSAGAKDVFCDYPASKSVNQNADNKVLIPYTSGVTNVGSLNVGDATGHSDSGVIAAFTASEPLYLYTSLQNTSSANTSYASYAVNDGGHTSYGELGINNSNYSYSAAGFPNNTFSAPLATFVESYGGPLAIGTWDSQKISFIVNGSVNTADAMTISAAGNVSTANDITVNGLTVGKGDGNVSTNTAFGVDAIGSPYIQSTNINNVGIGYNALNTIGAGVATLTNLVGGSGYDDGYDQEVVSLIYQSGTPIIAGGVFPTVFLTISGGVITNASLASKGYGFSNTTTVFTVDNAGIGGIGSGFSIQIGSLASGTNNTALGYNAGVDNNTGSNNVYIGSNASSGSGTDNSNEIVIGANAVGLGTNTVTIGTSSTTNTYLKGTVFGTFSGDLSSENLVTQSISAFANINLAGNTSGTNDYSTNATDGILRMFTSQTSGTFTLGGANATGAITIANSSGNQTLNLGTGTLNLINIGGTSATRSISLGRSTVTQTVQVAGGATASGSTKTMSIGTGGLAGSTTNIAIGSTTGTSTTTINGLLKQNTYLVANLPTGSAGARSFVTNALAPTFGAAVAGGGAVGVPVYHDGTSWKVG